MEAPAPPPGIRLAPARPYPAPPTSSPLLADPRAVAVGECGLDYYYDNSPREAQRDVFAEQVALASSLGLALVVASNTGWTARSPRMAREGEVQPSSIANDLVPFIVLAGLFCAALSFFELA